MTAVAAGHRWRRSFPFVGPQARRAFELLRLLSLVPIDPHALASHSSLVSWYVFQRDAVRNVEIRVRRESARYLRPTDPARPSPIREKRRRSHIVGDLLFAGE